MHGAGHDGEAIGVRQYAAEQLGQVIVQAAGDFTLVNQASGARGDENVGILPLMIVGGVGIGQSTVGVAAAESSASVVPPARQMARLLPASNTGRSGQNASTRASRANLR